MANVRLVVTNGCSFTHGTSLAEPERTCWPRVLADALDAPLVNLAAGGGSNHRLVRTTVEQLPQVVDRAGCTPQETLFVAMWTELARSEVYDPSTPAVLPPSPARRGGLPEHPAGIRAPGVVPPPPRIPVRLRIRGGPVTAGVSAGRVRTHSPHRRAPSAGRVGRIRGGQLRRCDQGAGPADVRPAARGHARSGPSPGGRASRVRTRARAALRPAAARRDRGGFADRGLGAG